MTHRPKDIWAGLAAPKGAAALSRAAAMCRSAVLLCAAVLLGAACLCAGCASPDDRSGAGDGGGSDASDGKVTLRVLFAGSLVIPFAQLEAEFETAHPEIDVNMEGHGSIQVIRMVSDLQEQADVVVTADERLIPMLLYTVDDPDSGSPYAGWTVTFASNKMALAYTLDSLHADEVAAGDWVDVVNRPGVRLGISDPRLDSNGYRVLMTMKLAEEVYDRPDLFADTFAGVFRVPIRTSTTAEGTLISVPEILEIKSGSHLVMRPFSVNLLPLLKSGDVDYAFEYESVARQHGLEYVSLPPEIDLSEAAYDSTYDDVTVKLDFQRFASVKPEFTGEPIRYGATIPTNARHPEEAATLLAFLLGPEGQSIMAENYQPMITPCAVDHFDLLPELLKPFCAPSD
ncbi:MAG: tungstate ABC transporter substrate-binding protein WtpA [Thermoleophilia bacterium]|nr:tungstate ABC transporter substrate-binding protein WtpA [Thermoleophilia bacterium]